MYPWDIFRFCRAYMYSILFWVGGCVRVMKYLFSQPACIHCSGTHGGFAFLFDNYSYLKFLEFDNVCEVDDPGHEESSPRSTSCPSPIFTGTCFAIIMCSPLIMMPWPNPRVVDFKRKGQHVAGTSSNIIVQRNTTRDGLNIALYTMDVLADWMADRIVLVLFC